LKFQPTWLDLEQFCAGLVEEMSLNLRQDQSISFQTVDRPSVGYLLELDEKLLRHILSNLLSNALKYSPEGGTVRLRLVYGAETVQLSVQDCGIGIPAADLDRLFESFHRASNVGTIPGTGLGLTIVQRSVALHGGQIHVASIQGEGTTFTVTLPIRNAKPLPSAIDIAAASEPPAFNSNSADSPD
jgi:signal transduction histidine kinase